MNNLKYLIILFLISYLTVSCQEKTNIPDNLEGMILCIEDLDGEGGIANFVFGDIVAYDSNGNRYVLTSDIYYDAKPCYDSEKNIVYFESKRTGESYQHGFASPSYLYILDLAKKSIVQIKNTFGFVNPYFNTDISKVCISCLDDKRNPDTTKNEWSNRIENIKIFDLITGASDSLTFELYNLFKAIITPDQSLLFCYTIDFEIYSDRYIDIYDFRTKERKTLFGKEGFDFKLRDYLNDQIIYSVYDKIKDNTFYKIYDLKKEIELYSFNGEEIRLYGAVFGKDNNEIFFSEETEVNSTTKDDIYHMDLRTNKITQISKTGNQKVDLFYCR